METINYNSRLFKNIFPDYETFKDWYLSTPLSDGVDDVPNIKTFTLIAYQYNCSTVSSSVESFKQRFAIDLYTFYKEFEETTKSILELMNLTDDEIKIESEIINNIADVPEIESSTNVQEVDFITQQQKTINKKGELQVKREQLSNKRTLTVRTFVGRFAHLFIKILSDAYVFVVGEDEEE